MDVFCILMEAGTGKKVGDLEYSPQVASNQSADFQHYDDDDKLTIINWYRARFAIQKKLFRFV